MKQSEDHMDELFRKAGENYPLKTDGADWDKVLKGLQQVPQEEPVSFIGTGRKKGYRKLWWLTLLLPLAFLCNNNYTGNFYNRWTSHGKANPSVAAGGANNVTTPSVAGVPANGPATPSETQQASAASAALAPATQPTGATGTAASAPNAASAPGAVTSAATSIAATSIAARSNKAATVTAKTLSARTGIVHTGLSGNRPRHQYSETRSDIASIPGKDASSSTPATGTNTPVASATGSVPGVNTPVATTTNNSGTSASNMRDTSAGKASAAAVPVVKAPDTAAAITRNATNKPTDTSASKKSPSIAKRKPLGLYGGILLGPDISTIKGQKIQDPGYSVGIIVGLRFNRHIAVEAGALWDHKNYYTSGEYFNTKRTDIPPGDEINYLNGYCNMIELPISFRWDFLQLRHSGLYVTGGLSSYLMKKEYYNYNATATNNGMPYSWSSSKSYLNSGNNFFSIAHFSAGYTFKWDHIGDVRIEPYWNIPMTGVGIGRMSIMSTGLYLGITHPFR